MELKKEWISAMQSSKQQKGIRVCEKENAEVLVVLVGNFVVI